MGHIDRLVVIAIGGNSLISDSQHMSVLDQYQAAGETSKYIAGIVEEGFRVVVTHGNGPQVGFILLRSEIAKSQLHQVPLESCVADTQGAIGYQVEQTLINEFKRRSITAEIATVVTQVVVDRDDPAFEEPSKPIGPFMTEKVAREHSRNEGWKAIEDAGRGWRRVVPSPEPLRIVELETVRTLLNRDVVVIAVGGGGIPVYEDDDGMLRGCAAVIDKDKASCLLAKQLGAEVLIISTGVDKVALNFGKPDEKILDEMTLADARRYLAAGQFPAGSMGPKIEAAIDFLENGGQRVIITQPHHLEGALHGIFGTHILP